MFDAKVMEAARRHAEKEAPRESCGLIVSGEYVPCLNVSESPEEDFTIAARDYARLAKAGTIEAVVHSHPKIGDPPFPSASDVQEHLNLSPNIPWCILIPGRKPIWFGDTVPREPLVGREFIYGVQDCYTLVRDWYMQNRGVKLPMLATEWEWWDKGENHFLKMYKQAGFKKLGEDDELEEGDVLLAQINSSVYNHSAVFLGNNTILHHLFKRLSCREPLTRWRNYFTLRFRLMT